MIYLDNASTTRIADEVLDAMMPFLKDGYGNPGSVHGLGWEAAKAVRNAREQVAKLINCSPEQIIFTSGGSEANNLVFEGVKRHLLSIGRTHIVTSAIEHDSVLKASERLCEPLQGVFNCEMKLGFHRTLVYPKRSGEVLCEDVSNSIEYDTGLVSVMATNNETGVSNDIKSIASVCKNNGILFHTDCVQALGFRELDVNEVGCDFLSMSGHKINAPKGTGALFVNDKSLLNPIINGGATQEYGLRGGTENVPGIVGFGAACGLLGKNFEDLRERAVKTKQAFKNVLFEELQKYDLFHILKLNADTEVSKIINLRFDGVDGETLLLMLNAHGICVSAGSACRSHIQEPSHVLIAMGLDESEAHNSVRFSFSHDTSVEDAKSAAVTTVYCVKKVLGNA